MFEEITQRIENMMWGQDRGKDGRRGTNKQDVGKDIWKLLCYKLQIDLLMSISFIGVPLHRE